MMLITAFEEMRSDGQYLGGGCCVLLPLLSQGGCLWGLGRLCHLLQRDGRRKDIQTTHGVKHTH